MARAVFADILSVYLKTCRLSVVYTKAYIFFAAATTRPLFEQFRFVFILPRERNRTSVDEGAAVAVYIRSVSEH